MKKFFLSSLGIATLALAGSLILVSCTKKSDLQEMAMLKKKLKFSVDFTEVEFANISVTITGEQGQGSATFLSSDGAIQDGHLPEDGTYKICIGGTGGAGCPVRLDVAGEPIYYMSDGLTQCKSGVTLEELYKINLQCE